MRIRRQMPIVVLLLAVSACSTADGVDVETSARLAG